MDYLYYPSFRQVSLTVRRYSFILLGGERHCESKVRGVARIFQRVGLTVSNIIVMAFSPRNIIGCFLKKGLQRGVTGTPGPPPPSLRP